MARTRRVCGECFHEAYALGRRNSFVDGRDVHRIDPQVLAAVTALCTDCQSCSRGTLIPQVPDVHDGRPAREQVAVWDYIGFGRMRLPLRESEIRKEGVLVEMKRLRELSGIENMDDDTVELQTEHVEDLSEMEDGAPVSVGSDDDDDFSDVAVGCGVWTSPKALMERTV